MSFSEYIGRFHAALVHIPIGIFLAVVVLEFLALKEKYKTLLPAVGILLRLGFVAACFAAGTGYLHKQAEDFDPVLVTTHLSFAITVIVVSLISIILASKWPRIIAVQRCRVRFIVVASSSFDIQFVAVLRSWPSPSMRRQTGPGA